MLLGKAFECVSLLAKARKGGMTRLETLVELKFLNSSFSSSNFSIRKSSDSRQQHLSQRYPLHLLKAVGPAGFKSDAEGIMQSMIQAEQILLGVEATVP